MSNNRQFMPQQMMPASPMAQTTTTQPMMGHPMVPQTGVSPFSPPQTLPQGAFPQLPTGTAQAPSPLVPSLTIPGQQPIPLTIDSVMYIPGYLKTQIGRYVKIEFLIGTNMFVDREGILVAVGVSYLIIQEAETDDLLLCDLYSIKFVRIYY